MPPTSRDRNGVLIRTETLTKSKCRSEGSGRSVDRVGRIIGVSSLYYNFPNVTASHVFECWGMKPITISNILESLSLVSVWLSGRRYFHRMVRQFEQGASVTAVSWTDVGGFFKSAPNVLNTLRDAYLNAKRFFHYSPPTITGSRSTIQVVDFGSVVSPIGIFQKCTKWLIGTLKRLFGPKKNFSNYVPPTMVS